MIVHENENYKVVIGKSSDRDFQFDLYLVENKLTGVIEMETRMLPQAKIFCDQLHLATESGAEEAIPNIEYSH